MKGAIRQKVGILNEQKQENNSNIILFVQGRLKNVSEKGKSILKNITFTDSFSFLNQTL